jgi:probable rRNA maturation factor
MSLRIDNRQRQVPVDRRAIERLVRLILDDHGAGEGDVTVVLARDRLLRDLNASYRDLDRPTDVLAFTMEGGVGRKARADGPEPVLGDVIISVDRAVEQSGRYGKTPEEEILKLVAHGVLHLLGHEHDTPRNRRAMRGRENRYLRALSKATE